MKEYMRLKMLKDLKGDKKPFFAYIFFEKEKGNDKYEKEFLNKTEIEFIPQMGDIKEFEKRMTNENRNLIKFAQQMSDEDFKRKMRSENTPVTVRFFPMENISYDSVSLKPYKCYNLQVTISQTLIDTEIERVRNMVYFTVDFSNDEVKDYIEYCIISDLFPKSIYDKVLEKLLSEYNFNVSHIMTGRNKKISYQSYKHNYTNNTFFNIKN